MFIKQQKNLFKLIVFADKPGSAKGVIENLKRPARDEKENKDEEPTNKICRQEMVINVNI